MLVQLLGPLFPTEMQLPQTWQMALTVPKPQELFLALPLKAQINKRSVFDRKNYFYPDQPPGYQISQYKDPIVGEGLVTLDVNGDSVEIGIERLHLETDAGKLLADHITLELFQTAD